MKRNIYTNEPGGQLGNGEGSLKLVWIPASSLLDEPSSKEGNDRFNDSTIVVPLKNKKIITTVKNTLNDESILKLKKMDTTFDNKIQMMLSLLYKYSWGLLRTGFVCICSRGYHRLFVVWCYGYACEWPVC